MPISFINHIRKFVQISGEEESKIYNFIQTNTYSKKEELLTNGQVCKSLHFVEKGCLRMYFINSKGIEQITQFAIDGWWITDFASFMEQKPSEYSIQTLESSKIVSIHTDVYDALLKEIPQLERYFRIILQKNMAASQHRAKYLYDMSKEQFYHHFSTSFPDFMQRVPQYMVASYLGLTPEYVSELRKKKA